jgi:lipopolysaccharide assembly outer membrane protein LptD (OstA)
MNTLTRMKYAFLLLPMLVGLCFSQENIPAGSASSDTTLTAPDSSSSAVVADSLAKGVDKKNKTKKSDIDTTVYYNGQSFHSTLDQRFTVLKKSAEIKYKNMTLKAGVITLDWQNHLIVAEPIADTVWTYNKDKTDSTQEIKMAQMPVLNDGGTQMTGDKMFYDYKTEKGRVIRGRSEFQGGYYKGDQLKRVDKKVLNVSHSIFTTCNADSNPHFHFESRRMKIILNDKIIAKPIIFLIGHIPVAALPFAIFPHKTGRQSGIIIPRYGESSQEGRYLRGLGYYWAPNDYYDANAMADFFDKSGWLFHGGMNYSVRYKLNGSMTGSFTRKNFSEGRKSRRWDMVIRHSQEIDPSSRFSVSGKFVSDKDFYRNMSPNLSTRLQRELRSDATYSKNWSKQKISLSVNVSRVHDLQEDVTQETMPQFNIRKQQEQIFKPDKNRGRSRDKRKTNEDKWYNYIYYSYNSSFVNSRREYLNTTQADTVKQVEKSRRLSHNLSLSMSSPQKFFGFLNINQSFNAQDDWFNESYKYRLDTESQKIIKENVKGFAARHTFSYSASGNTKLYGMIAPGIFNIQAIRHVVTPSLSFNYTPDFSDPAWGYYVQVQDASGKKVKQDRFKGTPSGGSKSMNLSVRNLFQMKTGTGDKQKKIDLFTMDMNTGFNFKAEKYRLSDLRSSWQANPAKNFSLSASTTHSFYAWDNEQKSSINKYILKDGGWKKGDFMRLTSLQLNFSLRLQGQGSAKGGSKSSSGADSTDSENEMMREENMGVLENDLATSTDRFDTEQSFRSLNIPWRMSLRFNFSLDKRNPNKPDKRYYLDLSGAEVNLTKNWKIGYNAHYDLETRSISNHRFSFYRDLHCWEASIEWVPSGISKSVFFRINIKEQTLRDIKLEKGGGRSNVVGYY